MILALELEPKHYRAIDRLLARYLDMDTANRGILIRDIQETGCIRVFGYGSLIRDPHAKPNTQFSGFIEGYERGIVHTDRHYRGTPKRLGLTMGIVPAKDPRTKMAGLLQIVRIEKGESSEHTARRIVDYIEDLARREVSLNPIYAYKVMDIKGRFGVAKGIVCATDETNPQFVGAPVTRAGGKSLTYQETAAIIAGEFGVYKASKRNTGLHYLSQVLGGFQRNGIRPEPGLAKVARMVNAYRDKLPRRQRQRLALLEMAERATFNRRVLGRDRQAQNETPRAVERHRHRAQRKLGHRDPLTPEKRAWIERNKRELSAARAG